MKYIYIIIASIIILGHAQAQSSFLRFYPEFPGFHLAFLEDYTDSTLMGMTSVLIFDSDPTGSNSFLEIDPLTGDLLKVKAVSNADIYSPHKFIFDQSKNELYILSYDRLVAMDTIFIQKYDIQLLEITDEAIISLPSSTHSSSFELTPDSILVLTYTDGPLRPYQRSILISDFSATSDWSDALPNSPQMFIYTLDTNKYLVYCFAGVFYLDKSIPFSEKLYPLLFSRYGKIISGINEGTHIIFGGALDTTIWSSVELSITEIDDNLEIQKSVVFGQGNSSFEFPAWISCIDKDLSHYYVAANANISLSPFTDTQDRQFIIGKFDADLNETWLHLLGGDRHYLIMGVLPDNEGGCFVYGFSRLAEYNYLSIPFLMRLNADGMITSTETGPSEQYHLTLYGNPGREAMRFGFGSGEVGFQMQLLDLQGKLVGAKEVHQGIQEINMAHAPAGMYIWQLYNQAGILVNTGKWMKAE
jgi:hypothetical protein